MSLQFHYANTTGSHTFDVNLGTEAVRLGSMSGLVTRASVGETGTGGIEVDDPDGSRAFLGLQDFYVAEDTLPTGADVVWRGKIGDRHVRRGGSQRPSLRTAAARVWSIDLVDPDWFLGARMILPTLSGSRPAETGGDRLAWLLGTSYCPVHDHGLVVYPTNDMDKCDYTGQTYLQVLADIAVPVSYNFFARYRQASGDYELCFYDPNDASVDVSALRASNVLGDADGSTTWYALDDAELVRSPTRVASRVSVAYTGGTEWDYSAATADLFDNFDHAAPMANVKTAARAAAVAAELLAQSDDESDLLTLTVKLPPANLLDVQAGQLVQARMSHMPGYEDFRPCRVLSKTIMTLEPTDEQYDVRLELVPIIESCVGATPTQFFPALYSGTSYADGHVMYFHAGAGHPCVATPYYAGTWFYPTWHLATASGPGGYMDASSNVLPNAVLFAVTGGGTARVYLDGGWDVGHGTGNYAVDVYVYHQDGGCGNPGDPDSPIDWQSLGVTLSPGPSSIDVPVPGNASGICEHMVYVVLTTPTANDVGIGFAGLAWVASP